MKTSRIGRALLVFGMLLGMSVFIPMPAVAEIEVDTFTSSVAEIELEIPGLGIYIADLSGTQTWEVDLGSLGDSDGNLREEVQTEIVAMDLTGSHAGLGPISIGPYPSRPSTGQIEETANAIPGTLDIPPFAPHGSADAVFDAFFEIEISSQSFHNNAPLALSGVITHKPPAEGEVLCSSGQVELFDENENPAGIIVNYFCNTPNAGTGPVIEIEVDHFPDSEAQIQIVVPGGTVEVLDLSGPTTVEVNLTNPTDTDGNGQEQVPTEMVQLDLTGSSPALGNVTIRLSPTRRTVGEIEENVNNNPGLLDIPPFAPSGTADSFFDVFFEIEVPGIVLHNEDPARIVANDLTHKPPAEGETYCGDAQVQLYDENGNPVPFGLLTYCHTPNPEPDVGNGGDGLPCPFSQGFWKNHPSAWPVTSLDLGGETYTQDELITLLKTPVSGDASLILAKQLIAAKLNVANGSNSSSIASTISDADALLSSVGGRLPLGIHPSTDVGQNMTAAGEELDEYNNLVLTPSCVVYEAGKKPKDSGLPGWLWILVPVVALAAIMALIRFKPWK